MDPQKMKGTLQTAHKIGTALGKGIGLGFRSIERAAETISENREASAREWQDRNTLRLAQENEHDASAIFQNAISVTAPVLGLYVTQGGQNYYRGIKVLNKQERRIPIHVFVVPRRKLAVEISTSEICSTLQTYMHNQTPAGRLFIYRAAPMHNSNSFAFVLMWEYIYNFYKEKGIL